MGSLGYYSCGVLKSQWYTKCTFIYPAVSTCTLRFGWDASCIRQEKNYFPWQYSRPHTARILQKNFRTWLFFSNHPPCSSDLKLILPLSISAKHFYKGKNSLMKTRLKSWLKSRGILLKMFCLVSSIQSLQIMVNMLLTKS